MGREKRKGNNHEWTNEQSEQMFSDHGKECEKERGVGKKMKNRKFFHRKFMRPGICTFKLTYKQTLGYLE